jgi:hypothetical protein
MWVRFVTNLSGQQVGCLPYERMSLDVLEASPEVRKDQCHQLLSLSGARHACISGAFRAVAPPSHSDNRIFAR